MDCLNITTQSFFMSRIVPAFFSDVLLSRSVNLDNFGFNIAFCQPHFSWFYISCGIHQISITKLKQSASWSFSLYQLVNLYCVWGESYIRKLYWRPHSRTSTSCVNNRWSQWFSYEYFSIWHGGLMSNVILHSSTFASSVIRTCSVFLWGQYLAQWNVHWQISHLDLYQTYPVD